jgi:hypothetical protein
MALLVALCCLLRFAVFIWSFEGVVKEKYCACVEKRVLAINFCLKFKLKVR